MKQSNETYGQPVLSESGRHVKIFRNDDVAEILAEADAPNG